MMRYKQASSLDLLLWRKPGPGKWNAAGESHVYYGNQLIQGLHRRQRHSRTRDGTGYCENVQYGLPATFDSALERSQNRHLMEVEMYLNTAKKIIRVVDTCCGQRVEIYTTN